MSARFLRLGGASSHQIESERRGSRATVRKRITKAITIDSGSGQRSAALLQDFSAHGCNFRSDASWLKAGRFIALQLADQTVVQSIVRWARNGSCGVEFLRPLPHVQAQTIMQGIDYE